MNKLDFQLWTTVLVYLYNHKDDEKMTALTICKYIDSTPGSISKSIMLLSSKGLLGIEKRGRINKYVLTDKGTRVAELLNKVFIALK